MSATVCFGIPSWLARQLIRDGASRIWSGGRVEVFADPGDSSKLIVELCYYTANAKDIEEATAVAKWLSILVVGEPLVYYRRADTAQIAELHPRALALDEVFLPEFEPSLCSGQQWKFNLVVPS